MAVHPWSAPHSRGVLAAAASVATLASASVMPQTVNATIRPEPRVAEHTVVAAALDNPRQLSLTPSGRLLVAQAGHGSYQSENCAGSGGDQFCVGLTGRATVVRHGRTRDVMRPLLSGAGPDGSFAIGSDGASKRPGGPYYSIITYAPPDIIPDGIPHRQSGKLLASKAGGKLRVVANIAGFERRRDPDGEGFDSNPYSVLALKNKVLVADAAGDYIAQVKGGKTSLWTLMPEYGKRFDAVPTTLSKGPRGKVYVGELHSELPREARVWKFDRRGNALRSWGGFTTVTGVARGGGSLYVSELFGGKCGFEDIPRCFPGRVVRVGPNGNRDSVRVPFPAGIATLGDRVFVTAFSVSPATGFGGNPEWSGQIWRIFG
ncbi:MAG: ScyD/ScyE family protein [Nocardioidaceae bacterium]|nr:ScyD/ScyE family protein [Nocardioidaceae bacterium]